MKVLVVLACLLVAANALYPAWGMYGMFSPALMYGAPYLYGRMALASLYSPYAYAYGALGMAAATNAAVASTAALGGLGWYKKK